MYLAELRVTKESPSRIYASSLALEHAVNTLIHVEQLGCVARCTTVLSSTDRRAIKALLQQISCWDR